MRARRLRSSPCRPWQPKVGVALTATLSDPDGGETDIEWQWSIGTVLTTPMATSTVNISDAESATYTPKANDIGGILTATVMYADAEGSEPDWHSAATRHGDPGGGGPGEQSACVQAEAHEPVGAGELRISRHVRWRRRQHIHLPECGCCGGSYRPQRHPNGDTLTYTLGGTDAGSFDIVQADGQITGEDRDRAGP